MKISLRLEVEQKKTVAELFLASTQVPGAQGPGATPENRCLSEDSLAIFRIAKEFSLTTENAEERSVQSEDLARMLRFVCWLLSYGGDFNSTAATTAIANTVPNTTANATANAAANTTASGNERSQTLREFFVTAMFQAQSQHSGFETILRALGIDRQLDPLSSIRTSARTATRAFAGASGHASTTTALSIGHSTRANRLQIRVDERGTEFTSTSTESVWTAGGCQQTTKS